MILEGLVIAQLIVNIVLLKNRSIPVSTPKPSLAETIRHSLKEQDGKHVPIIRHDLTTKKEWFVDGEPVSEEAYIANKLVL